MREEDEKGAGEVKRYGLRNPTGYFCRWAAVAGIVPRLFEKANQAYLRFKDDGSLLIKLSTDNLRDLVQLLSHHEDEVCRSYGGWAVLDKLFCGLLPMRPRKG